MTTDNITYYEEDLGRPAIFLLPARIVTPEIMKCVMDFLRSEYGGATHVHAHIIGEWLDEQGEIHKDRHVQFEASFLGKERIPALMQFLAELAHDCGEKSIYLKLGQYTRLIYPVSKTSDELEPPLFSQLKRGTELRVQARELNKVADQLLEQATRRIPNHKKELLDAIVAYQQAHPESPYRFETFEPSEFRIVILKNNGVNIRISSDHNICTKDGVKIKDQDIYTHAEALAEWGMSLDHWIRKQILWASACTISVVTPDENL